jgi:2-methylisocitrate lyase-like PEP mutase family enzyme
VSRLAALSLNAAPSDHRRQLHALLAADGVLELPVVCDPLGARMAAENLFEAVTLSGYAIGAHLPDGEVLSVSRVEAAVRRVSRAAGLPVLLDADAGLTSADELPLDVAQLVEAGASGILLSSQYLPETVPVTATTARDDSHADLLSRVAAVAGAEVDVMIAARLDADADAYEVVLERARGLVGAGADVLLVHSGGEPILRSLGTDLAGTLLVYAADPALPCLPSVFSPQRLERWGYSGVANKYHQCQCPRMSMMSPAHRPSRASGLG